MVLFRSALGGTYLISKETYMRLLFSIGQKIITPPPPPPIIIR
jgi:hypothetical protein